MGGGASRWLRAAKKIGFPCAFLANPRPKSTTILNSVIPNPSVISEGIDAEEHYGLPAKQNLCTICLEPLLFNEEGESSCSQSNKIFTAQCSHTFHLTCIASNIRHGNMTCPICRTHWPHLPRDLLIASHALPPLKSSSSDPILRILDDSIATSRVNRRSSLRSTRYNDDDPTEPNSTSLTPHSSTRLLLSFVRTDLLLRLAPQLPIDLVLVANPNGSHLRLLKQAIALVIFSLRPTDRLALVTCSPPAAATRAFALHRMSSHGKHAALQVIDHLSCISEADPTEGLQKAARILEDRIHRNPVSCILHLSDSPIAQAADHHHQVHWFHVGFGFGDLSGFVMHEFEEFLAGVIGEEVRDVELRIGVEEIPVRVDYLRCGEERRIPVDLSGESEFVGVRYEYKECGCKEINVSGEMVLEIGVEGGDAKEEEEKEEEMRARRSCAERWDYLDPFMARRWAKHLHGYRAN